MDKDLEAAIDAVGRERVFALVTRYGWRGASVPKFVWWLAVDTIRLSDIPADAAYAGGK
jgi:hypothetical protein